MKRKFYLFLSICLCAMLAGCDKDDDSPQKPEPLEGSRTVLVYIVGDNNIFHFIEADLSEMAEGMKSVSDSRFNLLIYVDSYGSDPVLFRFEKNGKGEVMKDVIKNYSEQVSTDAAVMTQVMNDAFGQYPSESCGLVYWSHAEGWLPSTLPSTKWVGDDGGKHMNISDLKTVLSQTKHLDFLLFDACFMVSIEVAYELREYTDFVLSSPTETPGVGAPYQFVVPAMSVGGDVVTNIAEAYMKPYVESFDETLTLGYSNPFNLRGEWVAGVSIGAVDCRALDKFAEVTRQVLPEESVNNAGLRSSVFNYDKRLSGIGYYDMAGFVRSVVDENAYKVWEASFLEIRHFWNTTKFCFSDRGGVFSTVGANGITHYIPSNNSGANMAYRSTSWYQDAGLSKLGW